MQHLMGLVPFQHSAEEIVRRLMDSGQFTQRDIGVLFSDNRGPGSFGFRPRATGNLHNPSVIEVVRCSVPARYSCILISVRTATPEHRELVEQVFREIGVLHQIRQEESTNMYDPDFEPTEWLKNRFAGYLNPDYRVSLQDP